MVADTKHGQIKLLTKCKEGQDVTSDVEEERSEKGTCQQPKASGCFHPADVLLSFIVGEGAHDGHARRRIGSSSEPSKNLCNQTDFEKLV
jgi:hypothetical protein